MTFGSFLLSALAVLVLLGALMFVGGLIPDIDLGAVRLNIGGALIPLGICVYLLVTADTGTERARGLIGAVLTSAAIYLLGRVMPAEPEKIALDPIYVCGIAGGILGWLLGRSRRGAFISGVLGVLLADTVNAVTLWASGVGQELVLGGAGIFDTTVISGILAVLLCELMGELMERVARSRGIGPDRARVKIPREDRRK